MPSALYRVMDVGEASQDCLLSHFPAAGRLQRKKDMSLQRQYGSIPSGGAIYWAFPTLVKFGSGMIEEVLESSLNLHMLTPSRMCQNRVKAVFLVL